mgnify:CR=1 FL=1
MELDTTSPPSDPVRVREVGLRDGRRAGVVRERFTRLAADWQRFVDTVRAIERVVTPRVSRREP